MIRAVIFDVDGVLLDSFEANFLFFQELFRRTGFVPPTREELKPMFHFPMWDVIKSVTRLDDEKKVEEIWNLGRTGEFHTGDPKLSEGVVPVVQQLSRQYPLAIVTGRVKQDIFEGPLVDLKQYFEAVVGYEDTKNHKPHPEPLLRAAEQLGIPPAKCVYIGDVVNDINAARAAGMKVIVYSKEQLKGADGQASDFNTIPDLIKTL